MSIKIIDRAELLEQHTTLAWHIYEWQRGCYDPTDHLVKTGESIWLELDDDEPTVLDELQAEKFNKEQRKYFASKRDKFDSAPKSLTHYGTKIVELNCDNFEVFANRIGKELSRLFELLGSKEIYVVADGKTPYLGQDNEFAPVLKAQQHLIELGISKNYFGGLSVSLSKIDAVFSNLFWVVRCNASAPYIFFAAKNSKIVGALCKYGNIHFEIYGKSSAQKLIAAVAKSKFSFVQDGICTESFSGRGAILGRELELK